MNDTNSERADRLSSALNKTARLAATSLLLVSIAIGQMLMFNTASAKTSDKDTDSAFWNHFDESSVNTINHQDWQFLLDKYLLTDHPSGIHRFKYRQVETEDKNRLELYLINLQAVDPLQYNRDEQMAYWINLYNALTVNLIIDKKPRYSILTTGKGWLPKGPWDDRIASVNNKKLTLNTIEHHILRPIWADYRIHFAVNCASLGCPNLQAKAFTSENLDSLLNHASHSFISHPRALSINNGKLTVSSIFEWYLEDFAANEIELIAWLATVATPEQAQQLKKHTGKINYEYSWQLNKPE